MSAPDRRAMLDRGDEALSVRRQCALLGVARSGVYRAAKPANDNDAPLMRRIDELFTAWPFLGSRRMTAMLRAEGAPLNRKRMQRLMRRMGIAKLGPKPRTTKPAPGHKIYPYLLRGLTIECWRRPKSGTIRRRGARAVRGARRRRDFGATGGFRSLVLARRRLRQCRPAGAVGGARPGCRLRIGTRSDRGGR